MAHDSTEKAKGQDPILFSKDELKKVQDWIEAKWPESRQTCWVCGMNDWLVVPDIIAHSPIRERKVSLGSTTYPHVAVTCTNCGHTVFLNAGMIGILRDSHKEAE